MKRPGRPARVRPFRPAILLALAGLAGLSGCDRNTLKKVGDSESILGFIPTPPSPAD